MKRFLGILLAVVIMAVWPLVGYSKTVIDFWNLFTGPDGKIMENIVKEFNASQDEIEVRMQILPWGDPYYNKLLLSIQTGTAPDVAICHDWNLPIFAKYGRLFPMSPKTLEKAGVNKGDFLEHPLTAGRYQGVTYGLPLDVHPYALYYNVDQLKAAGLDPNKVILDKENFVDAAKKLQVKDDKGQVTRWGYVPIESNLWRDWYTLLYQFGGTYLSKDSTKAAFNTEIGAKALQFFVDLQSAGLIPPTGIDTGTAFRTGKCSMTMAGTWMIPGFNEQKDLNYMTVPYPQIGNKKAAWSASHLLVLPKKKTRDKVDAAAKFVEWLTAHQIEWSANAGHCPTRKSVIASDAFKKLTKQQAFAEELSYLVWQPHVEQAMSVENRSRQEFDAVYNRQKTIPQALKDLETFVNDILTRPVGEVGK
jgi:ABC-type glycerol-3-phosphate transport system substrate-binding protein